MNENESRRARRRSKNKSEDNSSKGISNVFYWIIGILFLILIGLAIFIFSRSGDDVNLDAENDQTTVVEEQPSEEEPADTTDGASGNDQETTEEPEENQEETTEQPDDENNTENEAEEGAEEESETDTDTGDTPDETEALEPGDNVTVSEDAPLNEGYAINYNDGSSDRIAIKNQVIQATGLNNNLIEWWIGNNGPGRVEATVSSRDESEVYRVYLQYGNGSWHVTSYERLSEVPANLR